MTDIPLQHDDWGGASLLLVWVEPFHERLTRGQRPGPAWAQHLVVARVEKQWRHQGQWRLSVHYYVGLMQHYQVYGADQCRPVGPAA
jgi:hypothetical protein